MIPSNPQLCRSDQQFQSGLPPKTNKLTSQNYDMIHLKKEHEPTKPLPFNPIYTATVIARGAFAHTTNNINFISANQSRVPESRRTLNYNDLPQENGIEQFFALRATETQG